MFRYSIFFGLLGSMIFLAGCGKDLPDNIPPHLEVFSILPAPEPYKVCGALELDVIVIRPGEQLNIHVLMTDDIGLSQYKLDIHPNFDCHGHREMTSDWNVQQITDLHGVTEVEKVISVAPPAYVTAGIYHMSIQLVDLAGNEDLNTRFYDLKVFNPEDTIAPEIILSSPSTLQFGIARGDVLTLSGVITDNRPFNLGGNARIRLTYIRDNSDIRLNALEHSLNHVDTGEYPFDLAYTIPQTLVPGRYFYTLEAYDGVNNSSEVIIFDLQINP